MTKHHLTYPLLVLWLVPLAARAAAAPATSQYYQQIKRHYQKSLDYTLAKRYGLALREAQRGLAVVERLAPLLRTQKAQKRLHSTRGVFHYIKGRIYQLSTQWHQACRSYQQCRKQEPGSDVFTKATAALNEMRQRAGVRLTIESRPKGASLQLSSPCLLAPLRGTTPWQQTLIPGKYRLQLQAKRHQTQTDRIDLKTPIKMSISLRPLRKTPTPPRPTTSSGRTAGYVLLGIGLAGLATGAVFLGVSIADQVTYEEIKGVAIHDQRALEVADRGTALRTGSFVVGGLSGAFVLAGGLLLALGPKAPPPTPPQTRRPRQTPSPRK